MRSKKKRVRLKELQKLGIADNNGVVNILNIKAYNEVMVMML